MLEQLLHRSRRVAAIHALVLTPTRELAVQVSKPPPSPGAPSTQNKDGGPYRYAGPGRDCKCVLYFTIIGMVSKEGGLI